MGVIALLHINIGQVDFMRSACIFGSLAATLVSSHLPQAAHRSLQCTPAVVTARDVLELRFTGSHGDELGVRTPDGKFLFIAFEQETAGSVPPIASTQFKSMRSLKLDVRTAKGLESISGGNSQALFRAVGKYRFIVSENHETEDETGANQVCTVTFSDSRRR